jgi:intracellular sulfur oxidation DsrE/DsrF family protein
VEIGTKNVKKVYHGDQAAERVQYIQNIYRQLQKKGVPHVDVLIHAAGSTIYVEPKGIAVKPSNVKQLLDAIICVLRALQVRTIILRRCM